MRKIDREGFPARLAVALNAKQLNGYWLSKRSGLEKGLVYRYLTGQRFPSYKNLEILAENLDVTEEWLLGLKG